MLETMPSGQRAYAGTAVPPERRRWPRCWLGMAPWNHLYWGHQLQLSLLALPFPVPPLMTFHVGGEIRKVYCSGGEKTSLDNK